MTSRMIDKPWTLLNREYKFVHFKETLQTNNL